MRSVRPILLCLLAATLLVPQGVWASQHVVLVESFTNVSCPYCPSSNSITHEFVEDYGPALVLNVQYHVSWPSATDPFYLTAMTEATDARTYYGVNSVPQVYVDGQQAGAGSYDALMEATEARLVQPTPFDIAVSATVVGDQILVEADVTALQDVPSSGLVARIALVEPYVHYDTAPGSNGETDFYCSLRDMLPSFAGTPLTISNGQTVQLSESGTLDPSWQDITVVVWVQNDADKSVMQAASTLSVDYACYYYALESSDVRNLGELRSFDSTLRNVGSIADSYDIHIDKDLPVGWSASICANGTCYPPFQLDFEMDLGAGVQDDITVDIQSLLNPGQGTVTLTATSQADPSLSWVRTFKLISSGIPVLYVDDGGGLAIQGYFTGTLDALGASYATWNRAANGVLDATKLGFFDKVVWSTGQGYPSLDATDRAEMASYLEAGGGLFLTGMDVGWDMCDEDSPESSPEAIAWYQQYLGATYVSDLVQDATLSGTPGDPIGDGLDFEISDSGENAQPWPSEIAPYGDGVECIRYSPSKIAGVHRDAGTYKVVYFAFGFEGIVDPADREQVMGRVLDWLETGTAIGDEPVVLPYLAASPRAFPNPFNPQTEIHLEIGGTLSAVVKVCVYDLRGRLVRTLHDGPLAPGTQRLVWDGSNDRGRSVASGVYVARVELADQRESLKLTLVK